VYTSAQYRESFKVIKKKTLEQTKKLETCFDPHAIEQYETIRTKVLEPHSSLPYGYSFFINKGLLAWCRYQHDAPKQHPSYKGLDKVASSELSVSEKNIAPIVQVMTNMIFQIQQESSYGV